MYGTMIVTATYLYSAGQGAFDPQWWAFILTFIADVAIAGSVGR